MSPFSVLIVWLSSLLPIGASNPLSNFNLSYLICQKCNEHLIKKMKTGSFCSIYKSFLTVDQCIHIIYLIVKSVNPLLRLEKIQNISM